ncbi:hypothetical protein BKP35_16235 [Anaerobacillus arseniciselenatis]|uniref:Uncharacterized protein n=1 Tax=Anaerobacillus arseniciselenatis TaxID=85682 RepID=A0A1S2LD03_9BACI|nr:hypothetical protein [Anaerobacillus arseniciselenatis]OIJ09405.1 hypothetical protein BKP35_16235 [Anaerobacillus arseniciselenatis]
MTGTEPFSITMILITVMTSSIWNLASFIFDQLQRKELSSNTPVGKIFKQIASHWTIYIFSISFLMLLVDRHWIKLSPKVFASIVILVIISFIIKKKIQQLNARQKKRDEAFDEIRKYFNDKNKHRDHA